MHGNLVSELPQDMGALQKLQTLVFHNNCLTHLPDSLSALHNLEVLGGSGNRLQSLPEGIGSCSASHSTAQLGGLFCRGAARARAEAT